jgi:thiopurine S-methyltransferase
MTSRATKLAAVATVGVSALTASYYSSTHSSIPVFHSHTQPYPIATSASEDSANLKFWSKRWSDSLTGWHKPATHASLIVHGDKAFPVDARVLVPLCGKTVDMASLAERGREVIGVEGAMKAISEFASEQADSVEFYQGLNDTKQNPDFETFVAKHKESGQKISLLRGDFFDLNVPGGVDGVWDRAAFVAINPNMRKKYVDVFTRNLNPGGVILMSTFYRVEGTEEAKKAGPPFSVSSVDIWDNFGDLDWVESIQLVESIDVMTHKRYADEAARWKAAGLTDLRELVFVITRKETLLSSVTKFAKSLVGVK